MRWQGAIGRGCRVALRRILLMLALCALSACASPPPPPAPRVVEKPSFVETGAASFYGKEHQGKRTADGERFDMHALTAAHPSLPFNTVVRVTDLASGRMVKVRINDRGPTIKSRIIDLSAAAGAALGMRMEGTASVRVEVFASDQPAR